MPVKYEFGLKGDLVTLYEFYTIREMVGWLRKMPYNLAFSGKDKSSNTEDTEGRDTASYKEAEELLLHGWPDGARQVNKGYRLVKNLDQMNSAKVRAVSVEGFAPVVPLYLANQPQTMLGQSIVSKKTKVITLIKSISFNGSIGSENIKNSGLNTLAIVDSLERNGYRINLYVMDLGRARKNSGGGDQILGAMLKVKGAGERLNMAKIAFPIAHPSMLRRIMFRFVERCPEASSHFAGGYGSVPSNAAFLDIIRRLGDRRTYMVPNHVNDEFMPRTIEEFENMYGVQK